MQLLFLLSEFAEADGMSYLNLFSTICFVFIFLFVCNYLIFYLIKTFGKGDIFGVLDYQKKLSRYSVDVCCMALFSVLGFQVLHDFLGWQSFTNVSTFGAERVYAYSPSAQRLCTFQAAYEFKNLVDSWLYGDGAVFMLHHAFTGALAVMALHPFLHVYSSFFFGISEVSTTILCALACFDANKGIAPLGERYPTIMKALGVSFAIAFIAIRILIWPYISFVFWQDSLELLRTGTAHSKAVVYFFLVANAGLTILQVVWLSEIVDTAVKLFRSEDSTNSTAALKLNSDDDKMKENSKSK